MNLPEVAFTVLDTETTGFVPRANRIIEFASVRYLNGTEEDSYEQMIAIPTDIPPTVEVLTRIRTSALEGKPTMEDVRTTIEEHIGSDTLIIGQNVSFDIGMLKGEDIDLSARAWIDTSMLASLVYPELASYSLGYVSTVLNLNHEPVHRAMGDVNATLELLSKCWERLQELPPEMLAHAKEVMGRSSPGYRILFDALPEATEKERPTWLTLPETTKLKTTNCQLKTSLVTPELGTVQLIEESLNPGFLQSVINAAAKDTATTHWIAVKNLTATVKRLDLPKEVRVLEPPYLLLDPKATKELEKQTAFTADEATLLLKLKWYSGTKQMDFPVHGGERDVWSGKLACTEESAAYKAQFEKLPSVMLLDHKQLLELLASGRAIKDGHVLIDDASMLEDTATKAYGWYCALDTLRAASEGNETLTRFTDLLQLWIEKVRNFVDTRYLVFPDLSAMDARGLRDQLEAVLATDLTEQVRRHLTELEKILDVEVLDGRIAWLETRNNGSQFIQSVPERIGDLLNDHLYSQIPTTLFIPTGSAETLREILPKSVDSTVEDWTLNADHLPITLSTETSIGTLFTEPPRGKTVILVNSRRMIEDAFIKYTEALEEKGVTMICQNLSGGQARMTAEFLAADAPVVWLLTPWTYEGIELPANQVDRLFIQSLPFDHPSHAVFSRRAEHYHSAFMEYSLPRLQHRLFRLLRTFCKHRTKEGEMVLLDDRIENKEYGKIIWKGLMQLQTEETPIEGKPQLQML